MDNATPNESIFAFCQRSFKIHLDAALLAVISYCMTNEIALGGKLRELRKKTGISLRELARAVSISAPFLSDVELGRRYPSDEILTRIAKKLGTRPEELKYLDTRSAMGDLKRLAESSPRLGLVFQSVVEHVNAGSLSPEEIASKLKELYANRSR